MNEHDLDTIEAELALVLPADYRATMAAYPFPRDSYAAMFELRDDAAWVIERTRQLTSPGSVAAAAPACALAIGHDGCGGTYALDAATASSPVYLIERAAGIVRIDAAGLATWIDWRLEEISAVGRQGEAWLARVPRRRRRRES
jgi:hypothetical protein